MELERLCLERVEEWTKRCSSDNAKVAFHAEQSFRDIKKLQENRQLQASIRQLEVGRTGDELRTR